MFKKIAACITALLVLQFANAQQPPFYDEIQSFKHNDSLFKPLPHAILFVGSSSFKKWWDVHTYFPGYPIINRGFGGSSFPDLIRYADKIILPYRPKQILVYCGDNDLAASDKITADTVFQRFTHLFRIIRNQLNQTNIVFVSIKPSPARAHLMPKMEQANELIKTFLSKQKNTAFVDVYHLMLNTDGTPIKDLFIEDQLHMNAKGYTIWQQAIEPFLIK